MKRRAGPDVVATRRFLFAEAERLAELAATSAEPVAGHEWIVASAHLREACDLLDRAERCAARALQAERPPWR